MMSRRYSFEDYIEKVAALRAKIPDISITSDIIAGFPGETDEDHRLTLKALREIEFDGTFAFKFSPRPGTKAAKMQGNLTEEMKSERLYEILVLQDTITEKKNNALVGAIQEVLIEGPSENGNGNLTGRTRTNKIVDIWADDIIKGALVDVEIIKGRRHSLEGKLVG
jgi:tRNA-2-methylthio-N6-dimethylallyladenosine synthase